MKMLKSATLMAITALALGAPQTSAAQKAGPDGHDLERAEQLVIQARQLSENHQEYHAASKLYRKAAQLYGETPEAADAWSRAGLLAFYSDDNRAPSDLRQAGEIALAFGHVGFAAKAFLDGAWVAHQRGMSRTALDLATRGERLTDSPLLAEADREALKRRFVEAAGEEEGDGVADGAVVSR